MKAIARRLQRLERRVEPPAVESQHTRQLRARLEAGRLRCGLPPISPERLVELRGMSLIEILHSGRERAAMARPELGGTAPEAK